MLGRFSAVATLPGARGVATSKPRVGVVLIRDFPQLGYAGELRQVRAGYARNHLVPQGLAAYATPANVKRHAIETGDERLQEIRRQRQVEHARRRISQIQLDFKSRVNENQTMYGSITADDITDLLFEKYHIDISSEKVQSGAIRSLGVHTIGVEVEPGEIANLKINIEALSEPNQST